MESEIEKTRNIFICSLLLFIILSILTFFLWEGDALTLFIDKPKVLRNEYIKYLLTLLFIADIPFFCISLNRYTSLKMKHMKPVKRIKTVTLDKPLNLLENTIIKLKSTEELIEVAKSKKSIILRYIFNPYLTYLYVVENKTIYLYEKRLKKAPLSKTLIKKNL